MTRPRGKGALCTRCEQTIRGAARLVIDYEGRPWCLDCCDQERAEVEDLLRRDNIYSAIALLRVANYLGMMAHLLTVAGHRGHAQQALCMARHWHELAAPHADRLVPDTRRRR